MGQKPQIDAQILDLSTGTFIDNKLFHYINLFVNSFTAQNTVFIVAFDDGSITYKEFNLHDFSTSIYQGGKAITFLDSNKYSVIDGCGLPCTPQRSSVVNAIHDFVADSTKGLQHNMQQTLDTVAENFEDIGKEINAGFQIFLAHITPDLEQSLGENLSDLPATNKEQTSYANFLFRCKKRSHHPKRKTDYQSLLRKEIHGFEWNIHIFDLGGFNSLEGYPFFPEGHICLSNLTPKDMNIFNYQSLKCELEKVIDYMKENKKVVISIFLAANNCAAETIDKEIAEVLQNKKYNPLLTCADLSGVQKTLDTITIEEMIQKNKRLLFFCDQENVKAAHPSTSVSKQIQYI